ncbi:MAG: metal-dependent transcriptional regulator [Melioribacteraceae bacterium]|nr:metal-dependent transcriptional regulator [Melioribacteraceae bacterium]
MDNEVFTTLVGFLLLILLLLFFLPGRGLFSKWKRALLDSKRVRIEDALKHLYDCEYNNTGCSLDSISGNLSLKRDEAAGLIQKLQSLGLVSLGRDKIELTGEGRNYALRIIRVHRLWERYLADETSIHASEWHERAEDVEHILSAEQADELAAQIGNPLTDPHGDPIPSSEGKMPVKQGVPITQFCVNDHVKIIHLEDEPKTIFAQLVAEGLYVGQHLRIIEISEERVKFEVDDEVIVLAPIIAANISVVKFDETNRVRRNLKKLSELKVGDGGLVVGISNLIRGQQRRRLLDLGVVPGTKIKAEIQSLGGDPTGYRIRGATIAIRKKQASQIFIKEINE